MRVKGVGILLIVLGVLAAAAAAAANSINSANGVPADQRFFNAVGGMLCCLTLVVPGIFFVARGSKRSGTERSRRPRKYMGAPAPAEPRPFGYKAARFAAIVTAVSVVFGFGSVSAVNQSQSKFLVILVGCIQAVLILLAFIAAVVALVRLPQGGRTTTLLLALSCLAFNGLLIAGTAWAANKMFGRGDLPADDTLRQQLVGAWVKDHANVYERLELRSDGTFRYRLTGSAVADFSGNWVVSGKRLDLNVEVIRQGDRERIGKLVRWRLEKVEPNAIVIGARDGVNRYTRGQD